jgi:hypothetical protein
MSMNHFFKLRLQNEKVAEETKLTNFLYSYIHNNHIRDIHTESEETELTVGPGVKLLRSKSKLFNLVAHDVGEVTYLYFSFLFCQIG